MENQETLSAEHRKNVLVVAEIARQIETALQEAGDARYYDADFDNKGEAVNLAWAAFSLIKETKDLSLSETKTLLENQRSGSNH